MNDKTPDSTDDVMLGEYNFSKGERGKHAHSYANGVVVTVHKADGTTEERMYHMPEGAIILDPDVRQFFPDAESVNYALRGLIELIPGPRKVDKAVRGS
jgi:hypothetical protein